MKVLCCVQGNGFLVSCYYYNITVRFRKMGLFVSSLINRFKDKSAISFVSNHSKLLDCEFCLLMKEAYT